MLSNFNSRKDQEYSVSRGKISIFLMNLRSGKFWEKEDLATYTVLSIWQLI